MVGLAAGCATYSDIPLDEQRGTDTTGGEGAASGLASNDNDNTSDSDSGTTTDGLATTTGMPGSTSDSSGGSGGSGGDATDTPSSGGTSADSSGGSGGDTGASSGGVAGSDSSQANTGGTGGSSTSGGAGGVGGGGGSGGAGGSGGGSSGSGGVSGTGGTGPETNFRYARLVALTSQNGNPFTAIAELELLDGSGLPIDNSGWTVSADSEETVDEPGAATRAIDGDTGTYWHTEWGDYDAPLPHYLQIDLGSAAEITGFVYTPRQGGVDNGWILDWEFYLSNSATDPGTAVASGSFASGQAAETVNLP